jgi:hypothetical protein
MSQSMGGIDLLTDGVATIENGTINCENIFCYDITPTSILGTSASYFTGLTSNIQQQIIDGNLLPKNNTWSNQNSFKGIDASFCTVNNETALSSSLAIGNDLVVGKNIVGGGDILINGVLYCQKLHVKNTFLEEQQIVYLKNIRSDIQAQIDYLINFINPSPAQDFILSITMNTNVWIPNTTKDDTNTYTLFADNENQIFDITRGYVFRVLTANFGVRAESPAMVNIASSYTYSVWVKLSSLSIINPSGIVGDFIRSTNQLLLYYNTNGDLCCTHGTDYLNDVLSISGYNNLETWRHITVSYDNSNLLITMFINGVSVASKTKSSSWSGIIGKPTFGYAFLNGTYRSIIGYIDNIKIYGRCLSNTEITILYNYESKNPLL